MILYHPLKPGEGELVAANLRQEDRNEIEGLGYDASMVPIWLEQARHPISAWTEDGELAGVGGVEEDGRIWFLSTPAIERIGVTFYRQARAWLREVEKDFTILYNITDCRNKVHHRLLKYLGFKGIRTVYTEPYLLPYYEVIKLCASQSQPQA